MSDIVITKVNEVRMRVICNNAGIEDEMYEYFKCEDPNFTPSNFSRYDGIIRLYERKSGLINIGLLMEVFKFAKVNKYTLELDPALKYMNNIPENETKDFIQSLNLSIYDENKKLLPAEMRDYQFDIVHQSIKNQRCVIEAATSAGKSISIYILMRFLEERRKHLGLNTKTLIIAPSVHLVEQLYDNCVEYSGFNKWRVNDNVQTIHSGASKSIYKPFVISTWQGIQDQNKEWFRQFGEVLVDEVHTAKADKLSKILNNCVNADIRLGFTGTLANCETAALQVISHFGPCYEIIKARDLIEQGYASDIKIEMIELIHTHETCSLLNGDYQQEIETIISNEKRNRLIADMASRLKGNTVVLFARIDGHMMLVYEELVKTRENVFLINGDVKVETRKEIGRLIEIGEDIIVLATYGTFQQGISWKKIHNLLLAHPSKSFIRVIQTLGRLMRMHSTKEYGRIFDFVDNMRMPKSGDNHAIRHSRDRYQFYIKERHPVKFKKWVL